MVSLFQPLSSEVNIVDEQGRPTPQFILLLQKLGVGSGLTASNGSIQIATMVAHTILANKTGATASPTACTISDILDFVTTTRGSILFRGASGWQALAPGTANNVLQTNGPGADPTWVTPASGGGVTTLGAPDTLAAIQSISVNFYIMKSVLVSSTFTINKIAFSMGAAVPTTKMQPFVYASSATGVPGALLAIGPQVTGAVAGYNEVPLAAPLAVTKGAIIYIGVNVTTAALSSLWCQAGGIAAFAANGGSTVPANPCPAVTSSTTANQIHGFWAV